MWPPEILHVCHLSYSRSTLVRWWLLLSSLYGGGHLRKLRLSNSTGAPASQGEQAATQTPAGWLRSAHGHKPGTSNPGRGYFCLGRGSVGLLRFAKCEVTEENTTTTDAKVGRELSRDTGGTEMEPAGRLRGNGRHERTRPLSGHG